MPTVLHFTPDGTWYETVPDLAQRPGPGLAEVKAWALAEIDRQAEEARLRHLTPGAGQALEYQRTYEEALRAADVLAQQGPLDPLQYPMLKAELDARVAAGQTVTLADVVNDVLALAYQWSQVGAQIKRIRREAKLRVEAAATVAEVKAIVQGIVWP